MAWKADCWVAGLAIVRRGFELVAVVVVVFERVGREEERRAAFMSTTVTALEDVMEVSSLR